MSKFSVCDMLSGQRSTRWPSIHQWRCISCPSYVRPGNLKLSLTSRVVMTNRSTKLELPVTPCLSYKPWRTERPSECN